MEPSVVGRADRSTTKADLVEEVARATELTKKQAHAIVESVFDGIIASLRAGEKIEIRGFGCFKVRQRGARLARNPKKIGVRVMVPRRGFLTSSREGNSSSSSTRLPREPTKLRPPSLARSRETRRLERSGVDGTPLYPCSPIPSTAELGQLEGRG
jgi:integration host factor subunit beta